MVGFALMKMPHALNVAYERSPLVQQNQDEFRRFREAFTKIDPAAYRGIERCALSESPVPDPGWAQATPPSALARIDEKARGRLLEILGPEHQCAHYPCSFISTLAQAEQLLRLVDRPEEYEVVRLSDHDVDDVPILGFDVGYWGGGNYSILCDSVIWPMWHSPVPEAFNHLVQHLACLNAHMLFPDHTSADRFLSFYVTQPWAETEDEPGEFSVIRIETVA
jgi:hypothetical protein